jgi:hypothetical protein
VSVPVTLIVPARLRLVVMLYQLRGYILEEALAWLLRHSGYEPISNPDRSDAALPPLGFTAAGLTVRGRGADHQVDVLGEFAFTPPFSLPIRMFLEAKYLRRGSPVGLSVVRNAWATIMDINDNQSGDLNHPGRRYRYVYTLFSRSGFSAQAQQFAAAHQISLVDLSTSAFAPLRQAVRDAAATLQPASIGSGATGLVREYLRKELRTWDESLPTWQSNTPSAATLATVAGAGRQLREALTAYDGGELLLGFPPTPFLITLTGATRSDLASFRHYADLHPEHEVLLRRVPEPVSAHAAVWRVNPAATPSAYQLTFSLPAHIEEWITASDRDTSRTRWVKQEVLSVILIYRVVDGVPKVYRLMYTPSRLQTL